MISGGGGGGTGEKEEEEELSVVLNVCITVFEHFQELGLREKTSLDKIFLV